MTQEFVRGWAQVCLGLLLVSTTAACSIGHKVTNSPRAPIEQLLLTEATERSVRHSDGPVLPIADGSAIFLDGTGLTGDRETLQRILVGWLREQGFKVRDSKEQSDYHLEIITQALGTEHDYTFIGMPSLQSAFIPIALPELALYRAQKQTGYARFYVNTVELATEKFLGATPVYLGETYHNDYTVFFIFSWRSSNLVLPPEAGDIHSPAKTRSPIPTHTKPAE